MATRLSSGCAVFFFGVLCITVSAQSTGGIPYTGGGYTGGGFTGGGGYSECVWGETWSYTGYEPCWACSTCTNLTYSSCSIYQDTQCDINECEIGYCGFGEHVECYNYFGAPGQSYYCYCDAGYTGNPPYTPCTPYVDVCDTVPSVCGSNSSANASHVQCYSYGSGWGYCLCDPGYYGGGYVYPGYSIQPCVPDVDECLTGDNNCGPNTVCQNYIGPPGSFYCYCSNPDQYLQYTDSTNFCVTDVNECLNSTSTNSSYSYNPAPSPACPCDHSVCYNWVGPSPSYGCYCEAGYSGNPPYVPCTLYDYCTYYGNLCSSGYQCVDVLGGYICTPTSPPIDCGVLLDSGDCQVGYLNPPQCCTRISDQQPFASASAINSNLIISVLANILPPSYTFVHGLTPSTTNLFPPGCTFDASTSPSNNSAQVMYLYDVPFSSLSQCLSVSPLADRVRFDGYIVAALDYIPWGDDSHMGLWFFYLRVDVLNSTQVVSLLSVTPESYENPIDVEIHPQATLTHCSTITCASVDDSYFARVGDTVYFQIAVDAGSVSGTASLSALFLEDINHNPIAVVQVTQTQYSGLTFTFAFVVPDGTALVVKFIHALVSVDFLDAFNSDSATFSPAASRQDYLLAGQRFEILSTPTNNDASSASPLVASAVMTGLVALLLLVVFL